MPKLHLHLHGCLAVASRCAGEMRRVMAVQAHHPTLWCLDFEMERGCAFGKVVWSGLEICDRVAVECSRFCVTEHMMRMCSSCLFESLLVTRPDRWFRRVERVELRHLVHCNPLLLECKIESKILRGREAESGLLSGYLNYVESLVGSVRRKIQIRPEGGNRNLHSFKSRPTVLGKHSQGVFCCVTG